MPGTAKSGCDVSLKSTRCRYVLACRRVCTVHRRNALQNVVDLAMGEANYMDSEALARKTAVNNRRITKWARTENYKSFLDRRQLLRSQTDAFNISLSRYVCTVS
jgi:hypothetical protein